MQIINHKTVLIAPLDWGLGHATRCIPIIYALQKMQCKIIIAATVVQKKLYQNEFNDITYLQIPAYNIQYGKNKLQTIVKIFTQFNQIKRTIKAEHLWLQNIIQENNIDIVISDNRYGLYSTKAKTVFITHQLQPKSFFKKVGEKLIQKILYNYINQFNECWVVDNKGNNNLAGELSHPQIMPQIKTIYIGPLTRLKLTTSTTIQFDCCILLSGPEPQRTILEKNIWDQIQNTNLKIVLIRGLPNEQHEWSSTNKNIIVYNHLPTTKLNKVIMESDLVISRSGYSSVMDLFILNKKCIFIPTPGQTEQEYLATYLEQKNYCVSVAQNIFNVEKSIAKAKQTDFKYLQIEEQNQLQQAIENIITN